MYYRYCARTGLGHDWCCREGCLYYRGKGTAQVAHIAAYEVGTDRCCVGVKEPMEGVDGGVCCFAIDWQDHGVLKALDELLDKGGHHGLGGRTK